MTVHIAMWSGPRNLSTAMMRSFGARSDTAVSDEPFYAAYLRHTGDPQPMAAEIVERMETDWDIIARRLRGPAPDGRQIWYQKHMSHHMEGPLSIGDFPEMRHAFLIRDPRRVAASYAAKRTAIRAEHLGTARQRLYFEQEAQRSGKVPPVIDSDRLLENPPAMLRALCNALNIAWDNAMLRWNTGPHPDDGIWGSHWYDAVNRSTGFGPPAASIPALPPEFAAVADECMADYEALSRFSLSA